MIENFILKVFRVVAELLNCQSAVLSMLAEFLGALTGLGGGVVIVPLLIFYSRSTCTTQLELLLSL